MRSGRMRFGAYTILAPHGIFNKPTTVGTVTRLVFCDIQRGLPGRRGKS